jgi:hypothetical protein
MTHHIVSNFMLAACYKHLRTCMLYSLPEPVRGQLALQRASRVNALVGTPSANGAMPNAAFSFSAGLFPHRSTSRILRLNSKGSGYHPVGSGSLAPREIKGSTGVVAAECTHTTALASFQALWTPEGPPARCHMSTSKPCG